MSRGIRDLRELICVSRLTIRESDDDTILSASDDERTEKRLHKSASRSSEEEEDDKQSPDSGIVNTGDIPSENGEPESPVLGQMKQLPHPPTASLPAAAKKRRKRKKKRPFVPLFDLPKPSPLPPVGSSSTLPSSRPSSGSSSNDGSRAASARIARDFNDGKQAHNGNFDYLLDYMDSTIVAEWLKQANADITDLTLWFHDEDNYVHFAHFWLSDFPDLQKQNILQLEHGILLDQLGFAFASGRDSGKIQMRDTKMFLEAVFREYPGKLMSSKGSHLFLEHLEVLTSERQDSYRTLLSDVKCSTRIKQNAQWILATRSFALASVWTAIVNFFRRLLDHSPELIRPQAARPQSARPGTARPHTGRPGSRIDLKSIAKKSKEHEYMYKAIRFGYNDVIHYLLATKKVGMDYTDHHGRTLILSAIMQNKPDVLRFLLQLRGRPDVNSVADSGNTPLHAVANQGSLALAEALLEAKDLVIDPINPQCENATPLHLAVMHGHADVVKFLLKHGANPLARMGDLTATEMASVFGDETMQSVFETAGLMPEKSAETHHMQDSEH